MGTKSLIISAAVAAATLGTAAHAATIVTGGSATMTFTENFDDVGLTISSSSWARNSAGNYERNFVVRPAEGLTYEFTRSDGSVRTVTARESSQSLVDRDGNAYLRLAGGSAYISAADANGDAIETFANVWVLPQRGADADLFSEELRDINFAPTADPLVWADFENPGSTYTFTAEQTAYLTEQDNLRLCCTHSLNNLAIDTAAMAVDGLIDDIEERDINFDGTVDENDDFYIFDLLATSQDGVYDMALTETMASFLNFGFSSAGFADSTDFDALWGNAQGMLDFASGDVIGTLSYDYDVAAVPVPASLPLLLGGLGFVGLVARRQRRNPA